MPNQYLEILDPIAELLHRKNTDYGNSFDKLREEYGPVSFHVRIADKLSRIKQLDSHPALVKDEAIEDTIKDIIGYCTLELNFRKGKTGIYKPKCDGGYCTNTFINNSEQAEKCRSIVLIKKPNEFEKCVWRTKEAKV